MEKLKLEHLAPYLPYGLKWIFEGSDDIHDVIGFDITEDGVHLISPTNDYGTCSLYEGKPILRPLSDLTKDLEHNGESFVPKDVLVDRYDLYFNEDDSFYLDYYCIGDTDSPLTGYHIIQLLIQWHFDVFGLIEKGLAIDINTL